ncbi:MAG: hypothetical protein M1469_11150 [Bacteroidetes bacterium]|nr:hypothetical protein [Bacteroidota bacterium]
MKKQKFTHRGISSESSSPNSKIASSRYIHSVIAGRMDDFGTHAREFDSQDNFNEPLRQLESLYYKMLLNTLKANIVQPMRYWPLWG